VAVPLALVAATAVGGFMYSRLELTYTARTLLHVKVDRPAILYEEQRRLDLSNYQRSQIATVKSRLVGQSAARELEPQNLAIIRDHPDPAAWLEQDVQADFNTAPEILKITLKGNNPDEVRMVLNAVRDAYVREILNCDRNEAELHLKQLTDLAAKQDTFLVAQRHQLTIRAEKFGVRDLPALRAKYDYVLGQCNSLKQERDSLRTSLAQAEAEGPGLAAEPDPATVEAVLERLVAADPKAAELQAEIRELEASLGGIRHTLTDYAKDIGYVKKSAELAKCRENLALRREELRSLALEQVRADSRVRRAQMLAEWERVLAAVKSYLRRLEAEIQRLEKEDADLGRGLDDLELIQTKITSEEDRLKLAQSRIRALEVELQAPPRARLLEAAVIVETPRWDRPLKTVVAPAVGAFVLVLLLVAFLDARGGRVDGVADLEASSIRVVGAVPGVRRPVLQTFTPPEELGLRQEFLQLTDAIDMARAVITPALRPTRGPHPPAEPAGIKHPTGAAQVLHPGHGYVLVVTSSAVAEGKTVLAGHMAVRLARSGRRTLLIDTDVRQPEVHDLFQLPRGPGLGELLSGEAELPDVTQPGPVSGLDVITAGNGDVCAVTELLEHRSAGVLHALQLAYDVVILDTAPLLIAPETLVLSRAANGVLMSVMRDVSRVNGVLAGYERLRSVGAQVLGAIVSGGPAVRYPGY
jgi:capsular exopolysaccharide synthesis family protein